MNTKQDIKTKASIDNTGNDEAQDDTYEGSGLFCYCEDDIHDSCGDF